MFCSAPSQKKAKPMMAFLPEAASITLPNNKLSHTYLTPYVICHSNTSAQNDRRPKWHPAVTTCTHGSAMQC
jgi:hypothetical protein